MSQQATGSTTSFNNGQILMLQLLKAAVQPPHSGPLEEQVWVVAFTMKHIYTTMDALSTPIPRNLENYINIVKFPFSLWELVAGLALFFIREQQEGLVPEAVAIGG